MVGAGIGVTLAAPAQVLVVQGSMAGELSGWIACAGAASSQAARSRTYRGAAPLLN